MVSIASASASAFAIAFAFAFALAITYCLAPASDFKLLNPLAGPHLGIVLYLNAFCVTVQHLDRQACVMHMKLTQKPFSPVCLYAGNERSSRSCMIYLCRGQDTITQERQ